MQAALKEALDKAGMSGLLDASSAHSTISIKTSVTTGQSATPFDTGTMPPAFTGAPSPGYAQVPPPYSAAAMPRRRRSPWGRLLFPLLLLFAVLFGFRYLRHKADVPPDIAAAVKNADAAKQAPSELLILPPCICPIPARRWRMNWTK